MRHCMWPLFVLLLVLPVTLLAENWPTATPESVGMSSERLARIGPIMQQFVDDGKLPCVITMIARRGKVVYFDKIGYQDVENKVPVRDDTIFRMCSQTKPVTGVAVMILYEEGKFLLNDPVSKYLPEFAAMKVMSHRDTGELEDAEPILVKHLLTHTAGMTCDFDRSADPVAARYRDNGVTSFSDMSDATSLAEWTTKLSRQPLLAQPGTEWRYSVGMDVLGRLVEVWSGQKFDDFVRQRILQPLQMHDTDFYAPPERHDRLATLYMLKEDGKMEVLEESIDTRFRVPPKFPLGGGGSGLVSTPRDFFRFAQMLLNGGRLDGVRILSRKTVELMTSDHLPAAMGADPLSGASSLGSNPLDRGVGFGFTGSVVVNPARAGSLRSAGSFGWGGAAGTFFWIDPKEDMTVLLFTHLMVPSYDLHSRLDVLANQAIAD